jgi:hypothetical protein
MKLDEWVLHAFFASLFLLAISFTIFFLSNPNSLLEHFSTLALPIIFFMVLYFAVRSIGELRARRHPSSPAASDAKLPLDLAAPRSWLSTEERHVAGVIQKIALLTDQELILAFHHPDSAPYVRAAVAQQLATRNVRGESVDGWMPHAGTLSVPSAFPAGLTAASYINRMHMRNVATTMSRIFIGAAIAYYAVVVIGNLHRTSPAGWPLLAMGLVCLAVAPLISHGARARILLLRPFGPTPMGTALKRVVRSRLGVLGHVFTLSDKNYQHSRTLGVLRFFGSIRHLTAPLLRPSLRIASVWNEASYRELARIISWNFILDFKSAYSGGQAFNIASANNWWKSCIDLLLHSTDFIIMDVSRVQEGSAWELTRLVRREALDRTIFISHSDYADNAMEAINKFLPIGTTPELFLFDKYGRLLKPEAFDLAVEGILARILPTSKAA